MSNATLTVSDAEFFLGLGAVAGIGVWSLAMIPVSVQVWGIRLSLLLLFLVDDGKPAMAFALSWGPNGLFLYLLQRRLLKLPSFLVPVHSTEPTLYRRLGVNFVKRIVVTRLWHLVVGVETPVKPRHRRELLDQTKNTTLGAEVCHGATLVLIFMVALCYVAVGRYSGAVWISAFNVALNGYPVMLQRVNRFRVAQIRARATQRA